jgi:hypothetical protein
MNVYGPSDRTVMAAVNPPPLPRATHAHRWLTILPWLLVPYDSLTHLMGADLHATSQTLPLTALLSPLYLMLRGPTIKLHANTRRVAIALLVSILLVVGITACNVLLESHWRIDGDVAERFRAAPRQGVSLILGFLTYLMFCDAFARAGLPQCMRWLAIACVPTVVLAYLQVATGFFRVQGFSSEPSHLADMIVLAALPAVLVGIRTPWVRWVYAGSIVSVLFLTFSSTGLLKALFALGMLFLARGQAFRLALGIPVIMIFGWLALQLFEDNYVSMTIQSMYEDFVQTGGLPSVTFVDRFFGFIGPVSILDHPHTWFGYGLGGDTVYFNRLFDPDTAELILTVKGDVPTITSLHGKWLMYGGVLGYGALLVAWVRAVRLAPRAGVAHVMLLAAFASTLFSLGQFFLPYIWLWFAAATAPSLWPPKSGRH